MLNTKLDDKLIRSKILSQLLHKSPQSKNTIVIEELDLCLGEARIDLAVINGIAKGIEIKSDKDTLDRLDNQISIYNKVFDVMEIVVGESHLKSAFEVVPEWWGISIVYSTNTSQLNYKQIRKTKINKAKDPLSVIQLLWKKEALQLLEKKNLSSQFKNKSKDEIWDKLLNLFEEKELFTFVNHFLKIRQNWRFVHQLMSNDD